MKNFSDLDENIKNIYRELLNPLGDYLKSNFKELFPYWEEIGLHIIPNHFYFPVPDTRFLEYKTKIFDISSINFNEEKQIDFLKNNVKTDFAELNKKILNKENFFHFDNGLFDNIDAAVAYSFIKKTKPKTIIEIGSGYSTAVMSLSDFSNFQIYCIDPYPHKKLSSLKTPIEIIEEKVENVNPDFFNKLNKNDILFIDSSHVVKTGGDVIYLMLDILPKLKKGVYIHFHDIFIPLDYPVKWIKEEKLFWTEQYMLHSFLSFNGKFEIIFAASFMGLKYYKLMKEIFTFDSEYSNKLEKIFNDFFPDTKWWGGGSFWLKAT